MYFQALLYLLLYKGRLAQLARAPARHAGGHRFKSCTAHYVSLCQRDSCGKSAAVRTPRQKLCCAFADVAIDSPCKESPEVRVTSHLHKGRRQEVGSRDPLPFPIPSWSLEDRLQEHVSHAYTVVKSHAARRRDNDPGANQSSVADRHHAW